MNLTSRLSIHHTILLFFSIREERPPSKGAMLTHTNIYTNAVQSYEIFKHDIELGKEKCLTVIPLFHVFGMTSCMHLSILCGNEILLLPRFDLEEVLNTIKKSSLVFFLACQLCMLLLPIILRQKNTTSKVFASATAAVRRCLLS